MRERQRLQRCSRAQHTSRSKPVHEFGQTPGTRCRNPHARARLHCREGTRRRAARRGGHESPPGLQRSEAGRRYCPQAVSGARTLRCNRWYRCAIVCHRPCPCSTWSTLRRSESQGRQREHRSPRGRDQGRQQPGDADAPCLCADTYFGHGSVSPSRGTGVRRWRPTDSRDGKAAAGRRQRAAGSKGCAPAVTSHCGPGAPSETGC